MKQFFDVDQIISDATYKESFLIPTLLTSLDEAVKWKKENKNPQQVQENLFMLSTQLEILKKDYPMDSITEESSLEEQRKYLEQISGFFR